VVVTVSARGAVRLRIGAEVVANVRRGERRRNRSFVGRACIVALPVLCLLALLPGTVPTAGADPTLSISTTPALTPAFDPTVTDYTARCGKSLGTPSTITAAVAAPSGTTVSVAAAAPTSGTFKTSFTRAWDQSFTFVVRSPGVPAATYYVRCMPSNMPSLTTIRSGTPENDYYLLSAIRPTLNKGSGGFSTHYLEIVDTHGVPVWWYDAGFRVGDTKILPNGDIAWMTDTEGDISRTASGGTPVGISQIGYAGNPHANLQIPDNPPADAHDFEPLPDGNFLMQAYAKVSGVDLSAIGGLPNTCILDAEVEEVTPTGQQVWSWFASQHLSVTEINPDIQPTVALSTCDRPQDAWHLNSMDPLGGDFLISTRYTDSAYRINPASGDVVWKLGGSPTPQSLQIIGDPDNGVIGQHDARMWPDGTVSMFDNGTDGSGNVVRAARVVSYQIDTNADTATMVQQIQEPIVTEAAFCCGSARLLANGDWAIDYGFIGVNAEVTPSGSRVLSMNFNDPSTNPAAPAPTLFSYRMTPVPLNVLSVAQMRAGMDAMHVKSPTVPSAVPSGSGQLKVTWKAPTRMVSSAVTGYVVTPYVGNVAQPARTFHSTKTTEFIGGLKNGTAYQFVVAAMIGPGSGYRSLKSGKVVAGAPGQPGIPEVSSATSGTLNVTFAPPSNNGAKITSYTVACTSAKGGSPKTKGAAALTITLKGLSKGAAYTCTVRAANKRGVGPASRPSKATTA
jgi:hypothetical protein